MLCTPYHQWPAVYPQWATYLQWLVRLHALKVEHVYLLSDTSSSASNEQNSLHQLSPLIKQKLAFEFDLAFHFLMFQPPTHTPHRFFHLPAPSSAEILEQWAMQQEGYCQAQFFLGHNPFKQCWDALEYAGNRWWPTHAWCRGWTWNFGAEV
jgi:hypothetical protein